MSTNQTTTTTAPKTAKETYDQHAAAIRRLLGDLAGDLENHEDAFARNWSRSYGYAGDLAHLETLLREAHNFMNNEA